MRRLQGGGWQGEQSGRMQALPAGWLPCCLGAHKGAAEMPWFASRQAGCGPFPSQSSWHHCSVMTPSCTLPAAGTSIPLRGWRQRWPQTSWLAMRPVRATQQPLLCFLAYIHQRRCSCSGRRLLASTFLGSTPPSCCRCCAYSAAPALRLPLPTEIIASNGSPTTVSAFLDSGYGYYPSLAWPAVGILFAFVALFRIISTLAVSNLLACGLVVCRGGEQQ